MEMKENHRNNFYEHSIDMTFSFQISYGQISLFLFII